MAEKPISLCRNDILTDGIMTNTGQCTSSAIRANINVTDRFRVLGGSTGVNSTEYWTINGWDDSSNSTFSSARGEKLFSATTKDTGVFVKYDAIKYGRDWGCQIGFKNKPLDHTEYHYLFGVCGLQFDWQLNSTGRNESSLIHMGLLYAMRFDSTYMMPLVQPSGTQAKGQLYPGATMNYSGTNIMQNTIESKSSTGRICIRGSTNMCNWVYNNELIFLGLALDFQQNGYQSIGENQEFRMWNCRPMFSRDGMSSSYRAICPGKAYPWSEALDGYMAIA